MARILLVSNDAKFKDEFSQCFSGEHQFALSSGMEELGNWNPDIVVVDRNFSILRAIILVKRIQLRCKVKPAVLFVTGSGSQKEKQLAMQIAADDCVEKPFSSSNIQSRIQFWLTGPARAHLAPVIGRSA